MTRSPVENCIYPEELISKTVKANMIGGIDSAFLPQWTIFSSKISEECECCSVSKQKKRIYSTGTQILFIIFSLLSTDNSSNFRQLVKRDLILLWFNVFVRIISILTITDPSLQTGVGTDHAWLVCIIVTVLSPIDFLLVRWLFYCTLHLELYSAPTVSPSLSPCEIKENLRTHFSLCASFVSC